MMGELGELAGALEKWIWYGQPPDFDNMLEELGDVQWYSALALNTLQTKLEDVLTRNIAKLRVRYPNQYSDILAAEENRDREAERLVMVELASPTPVGIKCEDCDSPAVMTTFDSDRNHSYREAHYYCTKHSRQPRIIQGPKPHAKG